MTFNNKINVYYFLCIQISGNTITTSHVTKYGINPKLLYLLFVIIFLNTNSTIRLWKKGFIKKEEEAGYVGGVGSVGRGWGRRI